MTEKLAGSTDYIQLGRVNLTIADLDPRIATLLVEDAIITEAWGVAITGGDDKTASFLYQEHKALIAEVQNSGNS